MQRETRRPSASRQSNGGPQADYTFAIHELNQGISLALSRAFPREVWVRGEITGWRSRGRHAYFQLAEKEPGSDRVSAVLPVALLAWNRDGVDADLARSPDLTLRDGVEVRVRGRLDFYEPYGRLQLLLTGIDPDFTYGRLAANRHEVLRRLSAAGLLDSNAGRSVPPIPRTIGLVTSVESAAYEDFVQELSQSGLGFRVQVVDVRVQGPRSGPMIVGALRALGNRRTDVIVLARGGGSRSDLAVFDNEAVARMIAVMPVPVITGVGHEIDQSVADRVAHTSCKTPTAAAAYLVARTSESLQALDRRFDAVHRATQGVLADQQLRIDAAARHVATAASHALRAEGQTLEARADRTGQGVRRAVAIARDEIGRRAGEVRHRVAIRLGSEDALLRWAASVLDGDRLSRGLDRRDRSVADAGARVARSAQRMLEAASDGVAHRSVAVGALDPERTLARGYSITRDADGRVVRDAGDASPGDELITDLRRGTLYSTVHSPVPVQHPSDALSSNDNYAEEAP